MTVCPQFNKGWVAEWKVAPVVTMSSTSNSRLEGITFRTAYFPWLNWARVALSRLKVSGAVYFLQVNRSNKGFLEVF